MLLNADQKRRYDFCTKDLQTFLRSATGRKIRAEYYTAHGNEYLELCESNATIENINITALSLPALAKEAIKAVL